MTWRIEFDAATADDIRRLDRVVQRRVLTYLKERLASTKNPRNFGKPLKGDKKGMWRYRVGDYRIICHIEDAQLVVVVLHVSHRRKVYKK